MVESIDGQLRQNTGHLMNQEFMKPFANHFLVSKRKKCHYESWIVS